MADEVRAIEQTTGAGCECDGSFWLRERGIVSFPGGRHTERVTNHEQQLKVRSAGSPRGLKHGTETPEVKGAGLQLMDPCGIVKKYAAFDRSLSSVTSPLWIGVVQRVLGCEIHTRFFAYKRCSAVRVQIRHTFCSNRQIV